MLAPTKQGLFKRMLKRMLKKDDEDEAKDDEYEDDYNDNDLPVFFCFGGGLGGAGRFLLVFVGFDDDVPDSLAAFFELFLAVLSGSDVG